MRLALTAAALLAALAVSGCRMTSREEFVTECRGWSTSTTEAEVQRCADMLLANQSARNAYTADTWAGLLMLGAYAVTPRAACQTISEPYRGGYRTRTICY